MLWGLLYYAHIWLLSWIIGFNIDSSVPFRYAAYVIIETRTIYVAPVVDAETYAIALHEVGHLIHPPNANYIAARHGYTTSGCYSSRYLYNTVLAAERAASTWALHTAISHAQSETLDALNFALEGHALTKVCKES